MDEYIDKEAFKKSVDGRYCNPCKAEKKDTTNAGVVPVGLTICSMRWSVSSPLTLPRWCMGSGNAASHAPFAEGTDLRGLMQIYGRIGNHHIAPTVERRWTEVLTDGC